MDRKLERVGENLIRLAENGFQIITEFSFGNISLKKYLALEEEICQGYMENLGLLCEVGVERRWFPSPVASQDSEKHSLKTPPDENFALTLCKSHCEAISIGKRLLYLSRERCRAIALSTRFRISHKEYVAIEKKVRKAHITNMVWLLDLIYLRFCVLQNKT